MKGEGKALILSSCFHPLNDNDKPSEVIDTILGAAIDSFIITTYLYLFTSKMNQSLRRTRSRGSFTASTQHPYRQASNGSLSSQVSFGEGGHGGGKMRSRSSLLSLVGRSGRRVGSVPVMSSQGGCSKKKIRSATSYITKIQTTTSSSREELLQEGRSKSPLVEEESQEGLSRTAHSLGSCQSTTLIRLRDSVGEVKPHGSHPSQRVPAEYKDKGSARHNDVWGEAIGHGIPPASSSHEPASIMKLKTASPTSILKVKMASSSKRPTSELTLSPTSTLPQNNPTTRLSSPESRQRRRGLAKSWQSAMMCIQQHRQPISQPIPIVNQCPREREEAAITADAAVQYNAATWRMYNRIQTVRLQSNRAYAAPHELVMQERDNHSHITPEDVGVVGEEEEEDDGVFDLEL